MLAMTTFRQFNGKDYFTDSAIQKVLDSWNYKKNKYFLEDMNRTDIYYLSFEADNTLSGLIRGTRDKINSLFVKGNFHKRGIGSLLLQKFEYEAALQGSREIKLKSSVYAVMFYEKMGFRKTSGLINYEGLKVYSMQKDI